MGFYAIPIVLTCTLVEPIHVPEREIYIMLTDNLESQMIKSELERDWTRSSANIDPEKVAEWGKKYEAIQKSIKYKYKIIYLHTDYYPNFSRIDPPAFRFGKYGAWEFFDKRAFKTTSWPLLTLDSVIQEMNYLKMVEHWKLQRDFFLKRRHQRIDELRKNWIEKVAEEYKEFNGFSWMETETDAAGAETPVYKYLYQHDDTSKAIKEKYPEPDYLNDPIVVQTDAIAERAGYWRRSQAWVHWQSEPKIENILAPFEDKKEEEQVFGSDYEDGEEFGP